jgi:hypothetical protein
MGANNKALIAKLTWEAMSEEGSLWFLLFKSISMVSLFLYNQKTLSCICHFKSRELLLKRNLLPGR